MQRFPSSKKHLSTPSTLSPLLKRGPAIAYTALLFFLILTTVAFISSQCLNFNTSKLSAGKLWFLNRTLVVSENHSTYAEDKQKQRIEFPLNCTIGNQTQACSSTIYPTTFETNEDQDPSLKTVCPDYFRWIHEDLRPWKGGGITRDMVEKAKKTAHFRLVIIKGKAYVEKYKKSIQTRDVFTMWGILQLLRRYPGRLPDLELMFDCDDRPVIRTRDYHRLNVTGPPPLFRYCGDRWTEDIVFPDWSFWGW